MIDAGGGRGQQGQGRLPDEAVLYRIAYTRFVQLPVERVMKLLERP